MSPYYSDESVTIYHGDCRDILPTLEPVEACVTDPPYGLSFMGRGWDHGVPGVHFWELIAGALLPGAPVFAFGGTRTHHRLMCAIEDAGFEIRDCMMWLYGSGFPKSLDISKAIDKAAGAEREVTGDKLDRPGYHLSGHDGGEAFGHGLSSSTPETRLASAQITAPATDAAKLWHGWGTALKPAWEPIILAMKPTVGTFAANALEHGVAGLNIDGARIGHSGADDPATSLAKNPGRDDKVTSGTYGANRPQQSVNTCGRWPANVCLDGESAKLLDEQSGERGGGFGVRGTRSSSEDYRMPGSGKLVGHGDSGGASRFYYTSKASRADRGEDNAHPTVKPSDLMKWLCTLARTPGPCTILDPFMGSGTTIYAAKELGLKAIGIELDEAHCETAVKRIAQGVLAL